jgi:hypothetical protein
VSLPVEINPHLLGSSVGYQIQRSLRFNTSDASYLNRTPSASNRKTWTWSGWVKRTKLGVQQGLIGCSSGATDSTFMNLQFAGDNLGLGLYTQYILRTEQVFRDPSAWYHIVVNLDTTNATANNRCRMYVNGVEITVFSTRNNPTLNADYGINQATQHDIGRSEYTDSTCLDGYLTEVNFIDGQALTPSSFGETDSATGVWKPKAYTGTYGTNGFYLPFIDDDLFFSSGSGGQFTTTSNNSISRATGNDTSGILSGVTISGDFDIYWKYGTASGSLTPGDAYIVGVAAASYQSSYNYNDNKLGAAANTVFYTQYGASGFSTGAYVSGSQTDTLTSGTNPSTTSYVRISRSGSTVSVHQGVTPGSWTLIKSFTGTFSGGVIWFFGSGDKDETISLNNITFNNVNGVSTIDLIGIGADASGNGNNWFSKNISSVPGAGNDSLVDSPTSYGTDSGAGGEVRGSYATWNPLVLFPTTTYQSSITDGSLLMTKSGAGQGGAVTTIGAITGKFYAETTIVAVGSSTPRVGVVADANPSSINSSNEFIPGDSTTSIAYLSNGTRRTNSTSTLSWGSTYTTNDVIGIAFDADSGKVWFAKNGTWQASGDPAAGTNPAVTLTITGPFYFLSAGESSASIAINNGQRAFAYTAPSGFKALCTTNLPIPTIGATGGTQANEFFDATLYTGTGASLSVTNAGSFQPDLVWLKSRGAGTNNQIFDAIRGTTKVLVTNSAEVESTSANTITAFNSNGFTIGTNTAINTSANNYVAWQWNAGGSTVTNTNGTITSNVRVNMTSGFSIATWTGQTSGSANVGHGLGVVPSMLIIKGRDDSGQWWVYHSALGATKYMFLNTTGAAATSSGGNAFANTAPTSSVFTVGTSFASSSPIVNWVAYCFAPVAGYSAFGSYTGNGSTDGSFIYTGFAPRWILARERDGSNNWHIYDRARSPFNVVDDNLKTNLTNVEETTSSNQLDFLSNGFKWRTADHNNQATPYIYAAFAESPFKYALAR